MRVDKTLNAVLFLLFAHAAATAAPWSFSEPVDVSRVHGPRIFHHLGSGGRNALAVSSHGTVAIVWEDNRDGKTRCYVGQRYGKYSTFEDRQISGDEPCYEPAITAMQDGRFAVAWEEGGVVRVRIVERTHLGTPVNLGGSGASQVAITSTPDNGLVAAWAQQDGHHTRIRTAKLAAEDLTGLRVMLIHAAENGALNGDQAYPDILALENNRLLLAWEDRRKGHTAILASEGHTGLRFGEPQQINESFWGGRALGYGRGTGAMRVSLASADSRQAVAVWADKRDFRSGYDVYAAKRDVGNAGFGDNEKVQDGFADMVAQWHPEVAGGTVGAQALTVCAWDDDREGTADIWLSWRTEDGWSDDLEVPGASGAGVQVEPAIAVDDNGHLHLAWTEKEQPDGPTRIRYLSGTPE